MLDHASQQVSLVREPCRDARPARVDPSTPESSPFHSLEDKQFATLEIAFARHGGIATGEDLVNRLRDHSDQPISVLARWIVARTIVSFVRGTETLIPIFQFDLASMTLRPSVKKIIDELGNGFNDWEMALWFAEPSVWLREASPVDVLTVAPDAVFQAARTDRFVVCG